MLARHAGQVRTFFAALSIAVFAGCAFAGCDGGDGGSGGDAGPAGMDAGRGDAGPPPPCTDDSDCPATYCNRGSRLCCVPSDPPYEICGDRVDQNCDRRDASCGDTDRDGVPACRPGQDPVGGVCDCDDERADVRPGFGTVPGAVEACDGADNDCDGRIDESSQCCAECAFLGAHRDRADVCTVDGICDCSTDPGMGPCGEGLTCCTSGCVDVTSDVMNCGFCGARCTQSADRCVAGSCQCGDRAPCEIDARCTDGTCPM
jgi:hypothetical protein